MHSLSIGQLCTAACLLEVSAPKPGNVHRGADFDDVTLNDFLLSAVAVGPPLERAGAVGVGRAVLDAVRATRGVTATNTNLGTILLLAPLAAVPRDADLADGVRQVLGQITAEDARLVYEAIRLARPGGLGRVETMDVDQAPPADLRAAMRAAAARDLVARQYENDFHDVLQVAASWLEAALARRLPTSEAVIWTHLQLMAAYPDSLIARKCGASVAQQAADRAAAIVQTNDPGSHAYWEAVADLDFWLRADGHRRNPGTTADLVAASLFVVLRGGGLPDWSNSSVPDR